MTAEEASEPRRSRRAADPTVTPPKTRKRPILLAAGALLIALGMLSGYTVFSQLRDTVTVVAVREDVSRGEEITRDVLQLVEVTPDPALDTVPGEDLDRVVGSTAGADLSAGGLLTATTVTDEPLPPPGSSVVGIALGPGQMPATDLRPGAMVRIATTPTNQGEIPLESPDTVPATLVGVRPASDLGQTVVDVMVEAEDAALLAAAAATGSVSLILDSSSEASS